MTAEVYCCSMRRYFLLGLIGVRQGESAPVEAADFINDWGAEKMTIAIKFCPFCGKPISSSQTLRSPSDDE